MRTLLLFLAGSGLTLLACSHDRGTFALISSEVVPHQYRMVHAKRVTGESCPGLLSAIFGTASARNMYLEAARDAISQVPGANALIDAKFIVPRFKICARVEGQPVTLR